MSRLDSFIRRMVAQRDILDDLSTRLDVAGPVFEFGLGSGRTYDHLRERFAGRRIVVFESVTTLQACSTPRPEDLVIGDLRDTTARFPDASAAMIHCDIETGDAAVDATLAEWLPALAARLLIPGGYVASGCALAHPDLSPQSLPPGISEGRYALARRR